METTAKLKTLSFAQGRTYAFAALFAVGNIALPQLAHLIPGGGLMLLPIYFFTLVAAYKYGIAVGLLTAVVSPLANNLLFGMPPTGALPAILIKSVLLAMAAAYAAKKAGKISFLAVLAAVAAYQLAGSLAEWGLTGSLAAALQDIRIGLPGIALQVIGGYAVLKALRKA